MIRDRRFLPGSVSRRMCRDDITNAHSTTSSTDRSTRRKLPLSDKIDFGDDPKIKWR
jgi:hypothetical protein